MAARPPQAESAGTTAVLHRRIAWQSHPEFSTRPSLMTSCQGTFGFHHPPSKSARASSHGRPLADSVGLLLARAQLHRAARGRTPQAPGRSPDPALSRFLGLLGGSERPPRGVMLSSGNEGRQSGRRGHRSTHHSWGRPRYLTQGPPTLPTTLHRGSQGKAPHDSRNPPVRHSLPSRGLLATTMRTGPGSVPRTGRRDSHRRRL